MSQELEGALTNSANLVGTFGSEGGGGTSNYNDLINKPSINSVTLQGNKTASQLGFATVATSGAYSDLTGTPTIPAAQVNSDWNAVSGVAEILNKPNLSAVATSGDYDDLTNKPSIPAAQVNSDWNAVSGVAQILNKPTLSAVATSGAYSDLTGTPTIPAAQVNSDWNASSGVAEILNKPTVYQNASSLPISSSDPTDTKSYIDGHIKSWTSLGYFQLDNNATGDWTLNDSVENATDILFFVSIDITGQPYDMPRNSILIPSHLLDNSGAVFYDFYIGARQYFKITKVSNTKFNISLTSVTSANMRVHAYCR